MIALMCAFVERFRRRAEPKVPKDISKGPRIVTMELIFGLFHSNPSKCSRNFSCFRAGRRFIRLDGLCHPHVLPHPQPLTCPSRCHHFGVTGIAI